MISAEPAPCTARAAISVPTSGASAAAADAAANSAEPDRVEVAAAVAVAQRGAGDQQHGEAEVVRVDRPLELLDRRAEVEPDRAQRRRHHQRVQRGHQRADGRQRHDPSGRGLRAGSVHGTSFPSRSFPVETTTAPRIKRRWIRPALRVSTGDPELEDRHEHPDRPRHRRRRRRRPGHRRRAASVRRPRAGQRPRARRHRRGPGQRAPGGGRPGPRRRGRGHPPAHGRDRRAELGVVLGRLERRRQDRLRGRPRGAGAAAAPGIDRGDRVQRRRPGRLAAVRRLCRRQADADVRGRLPPAGVRGARAGDPLRRPRPAPADRRHPDRRGRGGGLRRRGRGVGRAITCAGASRSRSTRPAWPARSCRSPPATSTATRPSSRSPAQGWRWSEPTHAARRRQITR